MFGQASLNDRVGVWSLYRLQQTADTELLLKRAIKIAIHETGHIFSYRHCVAYSCAINETNHIAESDRRPIDFYPEDTAKIIWMAQADTVLRYEKLAKISFKFGLKNEGKRVLRKN